MPSGVSGPANSLPLERPIMSSLPASPIVSLWGEAMADSGGMAPEARPRTDMCVCHLLQVVQQASSPSFQRTHLQQPGDCVANIVFKIARPQPLQGRLWARLRASCRMFGAIDVSGAAIEASTVKRRQQLANDSASEPVKLVLHICLERLPSPFVVLGAVRKGHRLHGI